MKNLKSKLYFFLLMLLIWTLAGLCFASISYLSAIGAGRDEPALPLYQSSLARFYIWGFLSFFIFKFTEKFSFKDSRLWLRNFLIHIPACLFFSTVHSIIYTCFVWISEPSLRERAENIVEAFQKYMFFGLIYLGVLFYLLIVIAINAFLLYRDYQEEQTKTVILKNQLAQSQLQALKMQINPHFLFNTLHSISSLVLDDPQKANSMIARLGDFLRLTLENSDEQTVTLEKELNFLRSYLEIEQTRFQDRLTVNYHIEADVLRAEVPHLILQPLIENAIKHGIAPYAAQGNITISANKENQKLILQIEDNGADSDANINPVKTEKSGTGLANVRLRLEQIYGENFQFETKKEAGGFSAIIIIPFVV